MSLALEDLEQAKEKLLDYYKDEQKLKDAITNGEIESDIEIISENNKDEDASNLIDWLREEYDNRDYVDDVLYKLGNGGRSITDLISMGQLSKNKDLLNKAVKELKKEYRIEKLHKHNGYVEKINKFRKVYLK